MYLSYSMVYPPYLLFALDSPFSRPVLQTLLEAGQSPAALLLPNPDRRALPSPLPLLSSSPPSLLPIPSSLTQTAAQHGIPILTLGSLRHPETLKILQAFRPDFLLTACFPRLLPPELLALPRLGALNLHPSLLPAYRGPDPLFWQFYYGEARTGVTLHFMDEKADTGDIIVQTEVPFPDGITLAQAETLTAQAGAVLVRRAFSQPENLSRTPQPIPGASYQPHPTSDDLTIPTTWPARRAYNFIRAVRDWGTVEVTDEVSGQRLRVREAVGYAPRLESAPPPRTGREISWLSFADGMLGVIVG